MRVIAGIKSLKISNQLETEKIKSLRISISYLGETALCVNDMNDKDTKHVLQEANTHSADLAKLLEVFLLDCSLRGSDLHKARDLTFTGEVPDCITEKVISDEYENFLSYRQATIVESMSTSEYFDRALAHIASHAHKVILVDRFAVSTFMERRRGSGLYKLINLLREASVTKFVVYSEFGNIVETNLVSQARSSLFSRNQYRPLDVQICLLSDEKFSHDRHLRFELTNNLSFAVSLGKGAEVFANPSFREVYTCNEISRAEWVARENKLKNSHKLETYNFQVA